MTGTLILIAAQETIEKNIKTNIKNVLQNDMQMINHNNKQQFIQKNVPERYT